MKNLDGILKLADAELGAITANGKFRSREEIHSAYELIDIAKDIYCIWNYEDESEGMSYDGGSMRDGSYRGESYERDGHSYARGRYAKRDAMGRYSREGSYRGGSYERGYSRDGKEDYIEHLREMAEDAPDEQTRQSIHRMIEQMK